MTLRPTPGSRLELNPAILLPSPELDMIPMRSSVVTHFGASKKPEHRAEAADLEEDLKALHSSLDADGIIEPIKATVSDDGKTAMIWDGRHRHQWALGRGLALVPVQHVTADQGRAIIAATVVGRRHWTKGQKAWLAVNLHPELISNKTGPKKNGELTRETVATLFGVSMPVLEQAIKLATTFAQLPSLRERHEPGIWAGHGLGAVLAGIPGAQTTAGGPRKPSTWMSLVKPYGTLTTLGKAFEGWPVEDQQAAREATVNWLKKDCTPGYRLMLAEALAAAEPLDTED
jgi:hypothetical protein